MANQVQKCCRANFDDRPLTCRLPSKKARPAQNHPIGPKCVSPDKRQATAVTTHERSQLPLGLDLAAVRDLPWKLPGHRGAYRERKPDV